MVTRLPLYLLFSIVLLSTCSEEDDCVDSSLSLDDFIAGDSSSVETGERGLRYTILEAGSPNRPELDNAVTVEYTGYTTDRDTFDATTTGEPRTFPLRSLITGWQLGIPLIGAGGRIRLYVPSALGYGTNSAGNICPNTDLVFDIDLIDFE